MQFGSRKAALTTAKARAGVEQGAGVMVEGREKALFLGGRILLIEMKQVRNL